MNVDGVLFILSQRLKGAVRDSNAMHLFWTYSIDVKWLYSAPGASRQDGCTGFLIFICKYDEYLNRLVRMCLTVCDTLGVSLPWCIRFLDLQWPPFIITPDVPLVPQRPTAKELLKHKFVVKNAKKTSYLTELIDRLKRWKAEGHSDGDSDSDSDSWVLHRGPYTGDGSLGVWLVQIPSTRSLASCQTHLIVPNTHKWLDVLVSYPNYTAQFFLFCDVFLGGNLSWCHWKRCIKDIRSLELPRV